MITYITGTNTQTADAFLVTVLLVPSRIIDFRSDLTI
jgi:hypothetical protein